MLKSDVASVSLMGALTLATGVVGSCCRLPEMSEDCAAVMEFLAGFGPGGEVALPDPSSVYCRQIGGDIQMETNEAGQYGVCVLPDGAERDTWELFCSECPDVPYCSWADNE